MNKNYLSPLEITEYTIEGGINKVNRPFKIVLLMAIMAGVYIALGGFASSVAAHDIANKGLAKLVTGAVFPIGLMFVVINGADLFTGNCLIAVSYFHKRTTIIAFIKNLAIVLFGNFLGAVSIAFLVANSGLLTMSDNRFGGYVLKTAFSKTHLPFTQALCLAILCNIFVCAGIWMIYSAKDVTGKVFAGFFSIFAFAISGAEHVVANMYYVPLALFVKGNEAFVEAAHLVDQVNTLTWGNFLFNNVVPVTIGNILGGLFIGIMYYFIFKKDLKSN
ncbi:FdhC protein [Sporanaerobium hydrogeniformans]|uniref:FdhC protein n=1 Tax=Sporanaerobium hydrogeniformans TaxID=3072179 RepID=A0AC61DD44_9FIRM|nr:formate/nitrite transporter family protein [Sporanaerobium hydrogeniformans]PHV70658.1 FdhC protein [Sporanaerobium hydrogeniformans]